MTSPLKSVLDYWQQQYWLNLVARERLFGLDHGLALFSGSEAVAIDGPEDTMHTVTGDLHTAKTRSVVEGAAPVGRVVGDYEYVVTHDCGLLITLSDHARRLGLTPVIWAGHVPGRAEVRFSVEG